MKRQNYLNNKDLLKEIQKSKMTYCYTLDAEHQRFDIIVDNFEDIFKPEIIKQAKENRAHQLSSEGYERAYNEWYMTSRKPKEKPKQAETRVEPEDINEDDLIFRVMTYDHIPEEPNRKNKPKTTADLHTKVNFPPFKQYKKIEGEMREVVRSHWEGGLDNGKFNCDHGQITNNLAKMFIKLCERYSMRSNWRGYTYVDEMRSFALLQLSQIGLKFDESKSANPFAYYTATVTNAFTRYLNLEKRNQNIRDDLLQEAGMDPSWGRVYEHEASERARWDEENERERKEQTGSNF